MVGAGDVALAGLVGLAGAEAAGVTNFAGGGGDDDDRDRVGGRGPPGFNLGGFDLPDAAAPNVQLDLGNMAAPGGRPAAADFAGVAEAMAEAMGAAADAGAQTVEDTATDATGEATDAVTDRLVGPLGGLTDGVVDTATDAATAATGGGATGGVANLLRADPNEIGARAGAGAASVGTGFVGGFVSRLDAGMDEAARKIVVEGLYMGDEGQTAESRAEELKNRYGGGDKIGLLDIGRAAASPVTESFTDTVFNGEYNPDRPDSKVAREIERTLAGAADAVTGGDDSASGPSNIAGLGGEARSMFAGTGDTVAGSDGRGDGVGSRTTDEPDTAQATTTSPAKEVEKRLSVPTTGGTVVRS